MNSIVPRFQMFQSPLMMTWSDRPPNLAITLLIRLRSASCCSGCGARLRSLGFVHVTDQQRHLRVLVCLED